MVLECIYKPDYGFGGFWEAERWRSALRSLRSDLSAIAPRSSLRIAPFGVKSLREIAPIAPFRSGAMALRAPITPFRSGAMALIAPRSVQSLRENRSALRSERSDDAPIAP